MRVTADRLRDIAGSSRRIANLAAAGSALRRLDVVVSPFEGRTETSGLVLDVKQGTAAAPMRPIRAGEVVRVTAAGQYQVGTMHDAVIDPRGYPGGQLREYNLEAEPFRSAPHGSGVGVIGPRGAMQGLVVAPCGEAVAAVSGPLVVGVNDRDAGNNRGTVTFVVTVRPAEAAEWVGGLSEGCGAHEHRRSAASPRRVDDQRAAQRWDPAKEALKK